MRPDFIGILPAAFAGTLAFCALPAAAQTAASGGADTTAASEVLEDRTAQYSLRDLLGVEVISPEGETLGELYDVLYAGGDETLIAVVSVGGVLGLGEKLVAEPFTAIDISGEDRVVMNATPAEIERREGFDYAALQRPYAAGDAEDPVRAEYMEAWTTRMERWAERMDARAETLTENGQDGLDAAWDEARTRWDSLKETTEENWDRAVESFEAAFASFKDAWDVSGGD